MQYILLLIFSLIFLYLSWKKPIWAIAFIVLGLPVYQIRFQFLGVPYTLLEIMIWLAFLTFFVRWLRKKQELKNQKISYKPFPFQWFVLAWLIAATLATAISPNLRAALGLWKAYFIEPAMFFVLFIAHIKTRKDLFLIFYFLGISALFIASIAIYQKFTGWLIPNIYWQTAATRRVTSVFGYPNAIGLYLGPIIMLYLGWLWTSIKKFWLSIFKFLVIVCSLLAVYFAVSEAALIGLAVGLIVFGLVYNKKSRWFTILVLVLVLVILVINQPLRQAARDKILLQDFSGQIRRTIWSETWIMLKDRPILGAGLAGYQKTIVPYHHYNIWIGKTMQPVEIYLYPHNILFNFWSELGLFGLAVFVLILIKYFYLAIKNIRSKDQEIKRSVISNNRLLITDYRLLSLSLLCIMVVILIHGLVDVPYFKNDLSVMFWLFIGILTIITLNKNLFIKKES